MLSREQVDRVADLARLALTDDERERFRVQLSAILEHFSRLPAVPEADLPESAAGALLPAVSPASLRDDEPRPSLPVDDVLANAPAVEGDLIRVPAILADRERQ